MYEKILLAALLLCIIRFSFGQDPWTIKAGKVDAANYYGITVANGMIGIVSSPEPFKVKDVVLAGAYDQYGRGRVSNFLRSFNLLNMTLDIDGKGSMENLFPIFSSSWICNMAALPVHLILVIRRL